jgi:hypothetical protein
MAKVKTYCAKATVYLKIASDYADGIGEAQYEVRGIVGYLVPSAFNANTDGFSVSIAHATDIEILDGDLKEFESESDMGLKFTPRNGETVILDDGIR